MSKQVDERVVSMRFDNKQFESNVKTTMSTIDKLKTKLNFKGAGEGLDNINRAAKKVDMTGLGNSVETVRSRFSALEIMGVTALANITNSAVNAGKRIVSALTIDPIRSGFNEYELKMGSIQTIMASTGESLETVNKYLNELNQYSDDTIYSFQDMTQNIGKFTNAGVKLEDAVAAIKGISNEAAVSGANANEASRAMYNFAQALSSGYVKLIDWKSIELANMATVDFKNQLIETAVATGTLKKTSDGMYKTLDGTVISATKNFNESLQDQWMTSEVLITTLGKYADETTEIGKKATKAATEVKTFSQLMDTLKESAQSGWAQTWEILFGDFNEGKSLWTSMSETIGGFLDRTSKNRNSILQGVFGGESKWDSLNEKIKEAGISTDDFGEKLKEVAKDEGYAVDDLIKKHGSLTTAISEGALSKDIVVKTLKKMASAESEASGSTEDMTDKLEHFQKVVNEVWRGDYANGEARIKALTEAGYDYSKVQALVNKTVDGHKLTLDDLTDVQLVNLGYTDEQIKAIRKLAEEAEKTGTPLNELINSLDKPSGRELIIESLSNAFGGLGKVLKSVKKAWDAIFHPGLSEDEIISKKSAKLYKLAETIHDLSKNLIVNEETAKLWVRTFKGVFALLDIVSTVVTGPLKIAFKLLTAILEVCDINILEVTATLGDALVTFRNWVDNLLDFEGAARSIVNFFKKMVDTIKKWGISISYASGISKDFIRGLVNGFKDGLAIIKKTLTELAQSIIDTVKDVLGIHSPATTAIEIAKHFILGFVEGFTQFAQLLWDVLKDIGGGIIDIFGGVWDKAQWLVQNVVLGIIGLFGKLWDNINKITTDIGRILDLAWSDILNNILPKITTFISSFGEILRKSIPNIVKAMIAIASSIREEISKIDFESVMHDIGEELARGATTMVKVGWSMIKGFAQGLKDGSPELWATLDVIFENFKSYLASKSISLGDVMAAGVVAGVLLLVNKVLSIASMVVKAFNGIGELLEAVSDIVIQFKKVVKGVNKVLSGIAIKQISQAILNFAISIGILAAAIYVLAKMDVDPAQFWRAAAVIGAAIVIIGGLMVTLTVLSGKMMKHKTLDELKAATTTLNSVRSLLRSLSLSMLLIAASIALLGKIPEDELKQGGIAAGAIAVALVLLIAATKLVPAINAKTVSQVSATGKMIFKISLALIAMSIGIRMLGRLDQNEVEQGGIVAAGLIWGIIKLIEAIQLLPHDIVTATKKNRFKITEIGSMIVMISAGLLLMASAIKKIGKMSVSEAVQGGIAVAALLGAVVGIMAATRLLTVDKNATSAVGQIGKMVLGIGAGLLLMAATIEKLGSLELKTLGHGSVAILVLMGAIAALMAATDVLTKNKNSASAVGKIGVMVLGIGAGLLLMGYAIEQLGSLDIKTLGHGGVAILVLMGAIAALMAATQFLTTKKNSANATTKFGLMMLEISAALILMAGAIFILSRIKSEDMWPAVGAIALLTALVGGLMFLTKFAKGTKQMMMVIISISALIAVLALAIGLLSFIDGDKLDKPMAAISILLLVVGALLMMTDHFKSRKGLVPTLITMTVVIAVLAGVIALLSTLNCKNAIVNSLAVVVLLSGMFLAVHVLKGLSKQVGTIAKGALALSLLLIPIAGIAAILALMKDMDIGTVMTKVLAISAMLLVMVGVAALLGIMGGMIGTIALGALAITLLLIPIAGIALILSVMKDMDIGTVMTKVLALSTMLLVMVGVAALLGIMGGMVGLIALGALAITLLLVPIAGIALILSVMKDMDIGTVMTKVLALSTMLLVMVGVAALLGIMGGMIGTIALGTLAVSLLLIPIAGIALILSIMRDMDIATVMTKVLALSAMLLVMVGVGAILGVMGTMAGSIALGTLAISLLLIPLAGIAAILTLMDEMSIGTAMTKVLALSATLVALVGIGALIGLAAPLLLPALLVLVPAVALLPALGTKLREFVTNLGTFTDAQVATVNCAVNALVGMAKAFENVMPDSLWAFFGADKFATFIKELPGTASAISAFVTNLGTFSEAQVTTVTCAAQAVKNMSEAFANVTPDSLFAFFSNGKFEKFLKNLPDFAKKLNEFMKEMESFNESKINSVNAAVGAVKALSSLNDVDTDSLKGKMSTFGDGMVAFAGKIKSFVSKLSEVGGGAISTASSNVSLLVTACQKMGSVNPDTISNFGTALSSLGEADVKSFITAVNNATTPVITAGENLVKNLATGATNANDSAVKAINGVVSNSASAAASEENIGKFSGAGADLVSGFASGISSNAWQAEAKARAMARAAAEAAEEELQINSPSKVFRKIGTSIPEGFAQGIEKLGSTVNASTVDMSDSAINGVKSSIAKMADAINSDIDAQPTIRPVLDLSDIESGAGSISNILGFGTSVGVMSNLNSINSSMNRRNQNGANDDVVSAIDKLRKDLGNMDHASYTINGITYGEGTDVAEAIQTIVRAARVERRI